MVKKGIIVIVGLGVFFILLGRLLGLSEGRLEYAASLVTYPFLKVQQFVVKPLASWSYQKRVKNNLLAEYEQLIRQRDELLKEVVSLKGFAHYDQSTSDLRTYNKRFATDAIIAPILLKSLSKNHIFLLDAGTSVGVKEGMIAVSKNCLIGKVTESYPLYSKVVLLSDPSCKVAVYCPSSGAKGIHTGQVKGPSVLQYVDHRDVVNKGGLVLSSGLGGVFPRGFCVGKVAQVDSTSYGRTISISSCIDNEALNYVSVISPTIAKA